MSDFQQFLGQQGDNWCVCPQFFGPPDKVDGYTMRWLIVPGPPMSCTLVYQFGSTVPNEERWPYHQHPDTHSIHVCLAGTGTHHAEGHANRIVPGTVFYEGAGCRHATVPDPGQGLLQLCVQYPGVGYEKETQLAPEAGTIDRFGDREAFLKAFGVDFKRYEELGKVSFTSERWNHFVTGRQREK